MIMYPAIDLQNGRAVRLRQGKRDESSIYAENPLDAAKKWLDLGAEWLHIVDLDGAFDGRSDNFPIIEKLAKLPVKIQIGGGIRTIDYAGRIFDLGIDRAIIGTIAIEQPEFLREFTQMFPGRIGVSLDAADGVLKSRGWAETSGLKIPDIAPSLEEGGAAFLIYTDIERDGMRSGVNFAALENLLRITSLPVIAAGGVASMEDIRRIANLAPIGSLDGAISGRALYENSLDFREAARTLKEA
ncbi:MAG: 1-(5-phosphoribosyl)-5-[(5-phosphoribosylamino)methylideneamino]imidazole-4-carboxamide isomerase [Desulfovibrio sp.]|nr:1-(5-phosphoribosyl)-5-[(5-phosphoribosylamino)methylideneamino]imidazole-4-carboxamide isomerase [Desulfovibrio sp.]